MFFLLLGVVGSGGGTGVGFVVIVRVHVVVG